LGRCSARCWPGLAAGRAVPRWPEMKEEEENFSYYFPGAILNAYFDEFK